MRMFLDDDYGMYVYCTGGFWACVGVSLSRVYNVSSLYMYFTLGMRYMRRILTFLIKLKSYHGLLQPRTCTGYR